MTQIANSGTKRENRCRAYRLDFRCGKLIFQVGRSLIGQLNFKLIAQMTIPMKKSAKIYIAPKLPPIAQIKTTSQL
jgi:hypothetical protein